jgi:sarcosine oxidase
MKVGVVGGGVVGLSATAALVRSGVDAVCFERSGVLMGERSAGSSRIFRLAHTDPELVRLAGTAREGFARWAAEAGRHMIEQSGCVISGGDAPERAAAMDAVGAPYEWGDGLAPAARLPAVVAPSPALVDLTGGVVDVDAVRAHLVARSGHVVVHEPVDAVDGGGQGATVRCPGGAHRFDAVVVAAGAGTSALAAQVGIDTPATLEHHVRFTFPFEGPAGVPAWIDSPDLGLHTYQHRSGPGRWSVGGALDPELTHWERGREAVAEASRRAVLEHVRERLTVRPVITDSLYCTHVPGLGDGIEFRRNGPVLVMYGENLMKFAPVLGDLLAAAAVDGSTPTVGTPKPAPRDAFS